MTDNAVLDWLLDPERSDPSIRWQVIRDLLHAPQSEWAAERAKVETEGWGARLLALEDDDGRWAGGAHFPGDFDWHGPEAQRGADGRLVSQPWTATTHSLSLLREFGLDHFRSAAALTGASPDPRLGEAIDHIRSRRLEDGTWPLDESPAGRVWFDVDDGEGLPSRWVTLRAMRVLIWWGEAATKVPGSGEPADDLG